MRPLHASDVQHRRAHVHLLEEAARHVPLTGALLDLGCGNGLFTEHLPQSGLQYTGLDVSPEFIRVCTTRYGTRAGFTFRVADLNSAEFEAETYDVVTLLNTLSLPGIHAVPVLRKARVALRKGGRIIIAGPTNRENIEPGEPGNCWSMEGLVALLTHLGFCRILAASNEFYDGSASMVVAAT